ncbi:MAG: hypothetical protein KJ884_11665 [Gammaproteobacteria bacterium]|nr:hypothetical protein [Gammaproteobacteria bacterium]MBU1488712.1 hypothetical protein [Gammaproteobacteria bacterium]MBU2067231.1 hypothetical protein [Gammaproteobacteria bacterium]MBU2138827.1 hypothetical protein [Gammaproteobacteria bacterium]MBU2217514.1 hypothetical protein [Gammaproteobacteria bacterium]
MVKFLEELRTRRFKWFCIVGGVWLGLLLHLFSSELNKNQYRPLRWVTPEAFDYLYGLNAMAVVGINIQTLFLAGHDVVMRTY